MCARTVHTSGRASIGHQREAGMARDKRKPAAKKAAPAKKKSQIIKVLKGKNPIRTKAGKALARPAAKKKAAVSRLWPRKCMPNR